MMRKPWKEREQNKEEKKLKNIESYEYNLNLHYESKRKELDILLSSSLPHQISNIKMILWINFLFLGLSVAIFRKLNFNLIYLISYFFTFVAIALMLYALTQRRSKKYGSIDELEFVNNQVKDGIYSKSYMLSNLLKSVYDGVEYNRDTLKEISKYIKYSMITTFICLSTFFIFIVYLNFIQEINIKESNNKKSLIIFKEMIVIIDKKGKNNMAEKDERPKPSEMNPPQRTIQESEERTFPKEEEKKKG